MSQIYAVLTDRGAELEAAALATGVPVTLSQFCIGDANGQEEVTPDPARTALIHEVYRGDITGATNQDNQVTFTLDVPTTTGGYTIREVGILTDKGELYSVARSPNILKPTESNGAVISITYKYTLAVSSTSTITVVVYNDYLTPDAADKKYLQIDKNLSEIAANGDTAKAAARENIGIGGDIAYRDKANEFTAKNTFKNIIEVAAGGEALIRVLRIMYGDDESGYLSGQLNKNVKLRADGKLILSAPSLYGLRYLTDSGEYDVYHGGNFKPVMTVNGKGPDSSGDVAVSAGSSTDLSNYYTKSEVDAMISSGDYASATPGAVKSYGLFTTYLGVTEGDTATGASIYYTGISGGDGGIDIARGSQPAGIWKILGKTNYVNGAFLAVRIS